MAIPELFSGLCDDAALFPPGNAPLAEAVPEHFGHQSADFAQLVGPFVFPAPRVEELAGALAEPGCTLELSLTAPGGPANLAAALDTVAHISRVELLAMEIPVSADLSLIEFFARLADLVPGPTVEVYVEVPRGGRRTAVLDAIAATGMRAKFRTGGVCADLYPDERELGESIRLAVDRGIPFKATAGLHHAIRNTHSANGFEQHGFLNLMLAAAEAEAGASADTLAGVLALRDRSVVAAMVRDLDPVVRAAFVSYGTCSIREPLTDLIDLHLIDHHLLPERVHPEGVTA